MYRQTTILEDRIVSSVKVGRVLVSIADLPSYLNKFVRNLANYDDTILGNELQLIGSTTGVACFGKKFFVATKHQLKSVSPKNVSILVPGTEVCMTTAGFSEVTSRTSDDDVYDLCAFDFSPQERDTSHLNGGFFDLFSETVWTPEEDVLDFVAAGHAFEDQVFDIVDNRQVHCVIRSVDCGRLEQPNDPCLGRVHPLEEMNFDPNGFSGGAVFAICLANGQAIAKLAGIMHRANSSIIHFIKADHVLNLLKVTCFNNMKSL